MTLLCTNKRQHPYRTSVEHTGPQRRGGANQKRPQSPLHREGRDEAKQDQTGKATRPNKTTTHLTGKGGYHAVGGGCGSPASYITASAMHAPRPRARLACTRARRTHPPCASAPPQLHARTHLIAFSGPRRLRPPTRTRVAARARTCAHGRGARGSLGVQPRGACARVRARVGACSGRQRAGCARECGAQPRRARARAGAHGRGARAGAHGRCARARARAGVHPRGACAPESFCASARR